VLVDTTIDPYRIEKFWRRAKEDMFRNLGYVPADMEELSPHFWNCGMRPSNLSQSFETTIPGLFFAGEAPYVFNGSSVTCAMGTGWVSGKGAADLAASTELAAVKWEAADEAFATAFAPLEREGNGPRPFEVTRMVQDAFWEGLGLIRDEEGINNAIAELERIKAEVLPTMVVPDKSRALNNEWKIAMEVRGMIDCCLATGYASTMRKMSRGGTYCRSDYPELGDELFNTVTSFDGSEWSVDTADIVPVVMDADTLLMAMPRVSFANGFESPGMTG